MKFEEALVELRKGEKIRRKKWGHPLTLDELLNIRIDEILAEDWEVLEEPGKTFPEVFEAFKEGKKIKRKNWKSEISELFNDKCINLTHSDLLATDWEVINESLCSFP